MAVPALSAAHTLCEISHWSVSNLELQKILYIAQMFYLGKHNKPLVYENFEAWVYGPVVPIVYHHVKGFGNDPIRNVFHLVPEVSEDRPEYLSIKRAYEGTKGFSSSRLVSITHWSKGAWHKCYERGTRGKSIANDLIKEEFHERSRFYK